MQQYQVGDYFVTEYDDGSKVSELHRPSSALPPDNLITVYAFRSRFTADEKRAIYTAAKANVDIQIWLDDLASVQGAIVDLKLQATIDSVNALESVGLIAAGRAAEILA